MKVKFKPPNLKTPKGKPMTNYAKGRRLEQRVVRAFKALGHYAARSAASKSPVDVFVMGSDRILLIQLKHVKRPRDVERVLEGMLEKLPSSPDIYLVSCGKLRYSGMYAIFGTALPRIPGGIQVSSVVNVAKILSTLYMASGRPADNYAAYGGEDDLSQDSNH